MRTVTRLAAVAAVSVIMLAVVPGTASAAQASTSIQIFSQAQLITEGLSAGNVLVTVGYSCGPTLVPEGTLTVAVEQPTSKFGESAPETAICNDVKHKLVAEVKSSTGFAPGSASAIVNLSSGGLSSQTAQAEIAIK